MKAFDVFQAPLSGTQLIEASAGTGKTWTLCGLVLRLLLEQRLPVQQLLVVTFTHAATAELRGRIRSRLAETLGALRGSPPSGGDRFVPTLLAQLRAQGAQDADMQLLLDQALQGFDEASVLTIHGFCQRALADAPFAAGMPMALETITDDRALRLQVVQDFWRRHVAGAPLSPPLAATLLRHKDSPERWADALRERLARPLAEALWPGAIDDDAALPEAALLARAHASARALWQGRRDEALALLVAAAGTLHGGSYKEGTIVQAAEDWDILLAAADPLSVDAPLNKLHLLRSSTLVQKTNKGKVTPEHPFFDAAETLAALREQALQVLAMQRLRLLRALLDDAPEALRTLQRERHGVSFDNMLFNLHERLQGAGGDSLAVALRARFSAALIDEFQDTDPLQFAIFDRLFGRGPTPLFLIGDPKQAIYGFRGADLHTYLQARSQADDEHTLGDNQRSTGPLLAALNRLFGARPAAFMLPDLGYHPVQLGAKPRPVLDDRSRPGETSAALPLWQLPDAPLLPKAEARAAAAAACAGEIARLLGAAQQGLVRLDDRALSGGDIAVLVRSRKHGSVMRAALAALGVASVELAQDSVFDSTDAQALATLLEAMLSASPALRERRLRAALATELMGWDATALLALQDGDPRWPALIERFDAYRDGWRRHGLGPTLRRWMATEQVHARLLARADGERRMTNLLHLAELLQRAEREHGSPQALWRWMKTQRGQGRGDEAAQLRLESDRHLVQVVTIHAAKGLEYPIVFCPFLWDGFNRASSAGIGGRPWHRADGRAVLDHRDEPGAEAQAQMRLEQAAESLRLIYVALTRAVHRCHLVIGPYVSGPYASTSESGRSLINWLVASGEPTPERWLNAKAKAITPEQAGAAWRDWAAALPASAASLAPLPGAAAGALQVQPPSPASLAALPLPPLPPGWWIGSFSALTQGVQHERAVADHDARSIDSIDGAGTPARAPAADDILHFPRGPAAGDLLHALFEHADFADPASWPAAIEQALVQHPLPAAEGDPVHWRPMLARLLDDSLGTPIADGLRLRDLTLARRISEWAFMLPAAGLDDHALHTLLVQEGWPAPPLAYGRLQGYLQGFVDLVFEHGDRWYLADWKSNHLGHDAADYGHAAMDAAMQQHGYPLQGLLYALALQRHLQQRLPDYVHERDFGGVLYLFVRGIRPGWRQPDGRPCGVVHLQPPASLLQRLSRLLDSAES